QNAFLRRFPFTHDLPEEDVQVLIRRYSDQSGVVHLHALELDVLQILDEAEKALLPASGIGIDEDNTFRQSFSQKENSFRQSFSQKVPTSPFSQVPEDTGPYRPTIQQQLQQRQRPSSASTTSSRFTDVRNRPMSAQGSYSRLPSQAQEGYSRLTSDATQEVTAFEQVTELPAERSLRQRPMTASASYSRLQTASAPQASAVQRPSSAMSGSRSAACFASPSSPYSVKPSCEEVMAKVQSIVAKRRMRLYDRFQDFDRLRKGACAPSQFRTTLAIMRIDLSNAELEVLEEKYKLVSPGVWDGKPFFAYKDFCRDVADSAGKASPDTKTLRVSSSAALQRLLAVLRSKLRCRRLDLLGAFEDIFIGGYVGRTMLLRVLSMQKIDVKDNDVDLLYSAFSDAHGFNFRAFCDVVDPFIVGEKDLGESLKLEVRKPTTRYFNPRGTIVPHQGTRAASAPSGR
ncbi:unnamed protein product, partial [Polarella glacialis]